MEKFSDLAKLGVVLILVLMEDTLRVLMRVMSNAYGRVLILVLMEDTLRACSYSYVSCWSCSVLILVLMEDTLRA